MKNIYRLINRIIQKAKLESLTNYPNVHPTSHIAMDVSVVSCNDLILEEKTRIHAGATIMNGPTAKFVMKKWSGAAVGLTAICGNHMSVVGKPYCEITEKMKAELDKNQEFSKGIIIEEDVWIGANVTLLQGVIVGRGAIVGAGSVIRVNVPPYAIVAGNPAKIVAFRYNPSEIIEHEIRLYKEDERLSIDMLNNNYEKYFTSKVKDIRSFTKISL